MAVQGGVHPLSGRKPRDANGDCSYTDANGRGLYEPGEPVPPPPVPEPEPEPAPELTECAVRARPVRRGEFQPVMCAAKHMQSTADLCSLWCQVFRGSVKVTDVAAARPPPVQYGQHSSN